MYVALGLNSTWFLLCKEPRNIFDRLKLQYPPKKKYALYVSIGHNRYAWILSFVPRQVSEM